jgi:sec-independent protein translocase protein TatA
MIGTWQAVLILIVVVLLFGAKRIPDLAGSLGKGLREFKKATESDDEKDKDKKLDTKDDGKKS